MFYDEFASMDRLQAKGGAYQNLALRGMNQIENSKNKYKIIGFFK